MKAQRQSGSRPGAMRDTRGASWVGLAVVIALFATGCASARPQLDLAASPSPSSPTTCEVEAAHGVAAQMMWAALQEGVPATVHLVLRGAGEGALWGAIHGGRGGRGAWIGAVVGAGLGLGIGAVAGAVRGFEMRGNYVRAGEHCQAVTPPDEYVQQPEPDHGPGSGSDRRESTPPLAGER